MKTIEITCNSNGRMNITITKNERFKYATYKDVIDDVINTVNDKIITRIVDGNIYFRNSYITVVIKNYRNNKDTTLDQVIEKVKKENEIQKKKRLRKKKIKRVRTLAGVTIITLGIIFTANLISKIDINSYKEEPNNNITYSHNLSNEGISEEKIIEEDLVVESEEIELEKEEDRGIIVNLNVDSRTETDKFINTKNNYYDKISQISKEFGIDPRIMLAIATQETGEHRINTNTPALGLMQIEKSVWIGETISAYNFNIGKSETEKITEEKLKNIDFNIKIACMHFQNCLMNSNYDFNIAIQMYNFGYGNIEDTFKYYHNNGSMELNESLKNYTNEWLNYRDYIKSGDSDYLEHIISYIEDLEGIECQKENGDSIIYSYEINEYKPKI